MKLVRIFLVILTLTTIGFAVGYKFRGGGHKLFFDSQAETQEISAVPDKNINLTLFWQVWNLLHGEYYDQGKLISEKLVYGAIKGMVQAVGDPYTVFLSKDEQTVTSEDLSGTFSGIGIELGYKGTQLAVIAPLPGSPAEKAGIKPEDIIAGIKDTAKNIDKSTNGMSLPEAVQIIRGPKGTKITLAILRSTLKAPIVVDIARDDIIVPSVVLEYVGQNKNIAHIKLLKFGSETKTEWDKAVLDILGNTNVAGIILDVRNNPGGYLQSAVDVATDFLEKGQTVLTEQSGGKTIDTIKTETSGRLRKVRLVMLINGGSASASEILAGAMRDDLGIKLIGEKSFGKGTVQEPREFSDGTGVHVTIAKWLTPKGIWVHGVGLTPDITISVDPNTTADKVLDSAIQTILSK